MTDPQASPFEPPPQPPRFQPGYYNAGPDAPRSAGMAVASLVCGIVGLVTICLWYLSVPLAIVAVVLGLVARGNVRRGTAAGGGMALAGAICGVVTLAVDSAAIVAVLVVIAVKSGTFHL